jgi:regulator of protease activity HflC (stomatin/prohibitin superfamily)
VIRPGEPNLDGGDIVEYVLPVLLLLIAALVVIAVVREVHVVTIHDYERGLRFNRGRLAGLVDPGMHVTFGPLSEIRPLDVRPAMLPIEGQEVLTAEGVAAKISLVARYVVGDPVAALTRDTAWARTMYLLLQLALRDAVTRRTLEETLAARREIGPEIRQAAAGRLAELGVELLEVEVRDVMLPGELKRSYASVLVARKEGEAALERARAETATLRSLANAGRTVADNPGLLQLRILQEIGASSGNTVVFGAPDAGRVTKAVTAAPSPPDAAGPAVAAAPRSGRSTRGAPDA